MFARLISQTNQIFEWDNTAKSQFIYFFSSLLTIYGASAMVGIYQYTVDNDIHSLSSHGVMQGVSGATAYSLICLFLGFLGFFLRRYRLDIPVYTYLCLHLYTLGNVFFLYFFGVFNIIAGVAMAGGVIIGLIMFTKRVVFPAFFMGVAASLVIFGLSYFQVIPYAAILIDPSTKNTNFWWSLLTIMVAGPHIASLIYLTVVCVDRWVEREQRVKILSILDPLTECFNRRHFLELAEEKLQECLSANQPVAFIILDIDHFKRINDNHNHQIGDYVIQVISSYVMDAARRQDIVCRYGGEEFCIFLPNCDVQTAKLVAERCRIQIQYRPILTEGLSLPVTASFGIVHSSQKEAVPNLTSLIAQADQALYKAKRTGRNKCNTVAYNPNISIAVTTLK